MQQQQPVFILPSAESFQRIENIKQQIETLERNIQESEANDRVVEKGIKDSLAFLRAQHENLMLWQRCMIPQAFPPGLVYVAQGGHAFYHTQIPDAAGMQQAAFARSMNVVVPSPPKITPIKTLSYPTRRSSRPKKSTATEVTVTIHTRAKKSSTITSKKDKPNPLIMPHADANPGVNPFKDALERSQAAVEINGNKVVKQRNDIVWINGKSYVPDAFRWWTDLNGNKFFVYMPNMLWDNSRQQFAIRILFSVPNLYTIYHGTSLDPCFEAVRNLHQLADSVLSRMWYVKVLPASIFISSSNSKLTCISPMHRSPRPPCTGSRPTPSTSRATRILTGTRRATRSGSSATPTSAATSTPSRPCRTRPVSTSSSRRRLRSRTSCRVSIPSWRPSSRRTSARPASSGSPSVTVSGACWIFVLGPDMLSI